MKHRLLMIASCLVPGLIAACGGGGGSAGNPASGGTGGTVAAAIDKYVGTWSACIADTSTTSHQESLTIARSTDASANFTMTDVRFAGTTCSGSVLATSTQTGTLVLTGTKTIGTDTVDEAIISAGSNAPQQQVLLVKGTAPAALTTGVSASDGGPVDANGYPTTLGTTALIKQAGTGVTATVTIDKYVGSWAACIPNGSGTGSHLETIAVAKTGDTSGTFTLTRLDYAIAGCTGTATTSTSSGTLQFTGTKTIGADTVDEAIQTEGTNPPEKQVFLVKDTAPVTLTTGVLASDGGPVDANGYPTTLDNHPLTKQ